MDTSRTALPKISFVQARVEDLEQLLALRIEAMRESLERIGRFDPARARERFASGFDPERTRHIMLGEQRVGFVVLQHLPDLVLLEHLYVRPEFQGRGIGAQVLGDIFALADATGVEVRVGALRESDSNRFYLRHGFVRVEEGEWDIYYVRQPCKT